MIVSQFQAWAETVAPPSRADGVSALGRAYLYSDLDADQRHEAMLALTAFLDDPSPLVRRAMADAFASAADAPHHIVLALAEDQPAIAAIVLGRSPILCDAELIDCLPGADRVAQRAVATRPGLSDAVAAAVAEIACPDALVALVENGGADLSDSAIRRMVQRHGGDAALREALLARGHLPIDARAELLAAAAGALAAFVTERNWMSPERTKRVTRDATERATITIAVTSETDDKDMRDLVAHLRATGQLTVAFTLRALLSGNRPLFGAILCDLSGMARARADGLVRHFESGGFAALYRKAGLPDAFLPAFRLGLAALRDRDIDGDDGLALSTALIAPVLGGCVALGNPELDPLIVLLRRFEAEAARDEARAHKTARPAVRPPAALIERAAPASRAQIDEMLLATIDFDEAVPTERAVPMAAPEPARFTIDLAAIEAELIAA